MTKNDYTYWIKQWSRELGFDHCGIAEAVRLDEDARKLERWLNKGMQGTMQYMENHFDLRIDPSRLVPGAKSVITLLMNFFRGYCRNRMRHGSRNMHLGMITTK